MAPPAAGEAWAPALRGEGGLICLLLAPAESACACNSRGSANAGIFVSHSNLAVSVDGSFF